MLGPFADSKAGGVYRLPPSGGGGTYEMSLPDDQGEETMGRQSIKAMAI